MRNIAKSVEKEERKRERLAISLKFFMPVTSSDSLNFSFLSKMNITEQPNL